MRYRTSLADTPRLAFPIYPIVSRNCPLTQIILPKAGRIRIYRAPRNSTADMPVRLRSGSCCRDTLGLPITDDDDDESAIEAYIVSVNKILEHFLAHVTNAIECIDGTTDTYKRLEYDVLLCLIGNVRIIVREIDRVWTQSKPRGVHEGINSRNPKIVNCKICSQLCRHYLTNYEFNLFVCTMNFSNSTQRESMTFCR